MNMPNLQGHMPRQVGGQGSNESQNYMRPNVPPNQSLPQQYFGQQYQHHQYPPQQQIPFHQYNAGSQYGGQHVLQPQNLPQNSGYQLQSNIYQQQIPNYQDRPVGHQLPMRNEQQFQNPNFGRTGYIPPINEKNFPRSQPLQSDSNRHIVLQQQERLHEEKIVGQNLQQHYVQRMVTQEYVPENVFANDPSKQVNRPHPPPPPTMFYDNQRRPDIQNRPAFEDKRESLDNLSEEQRMKLNVARNMQVNPNEYQQAATYSRINSNLSGEIKSLQRIPSQLGSIQYSMIPSTNQPHHVIIRREDIDPEYEKALKKLKENEQKIKILLERQQIDGKITDAKEKIEKLERIIHFKEKASLNFINRFINVTDSKIKDENLCKPVIDAFDNIVKAGDKYDHFQIPHYDPFQIIKERLGVPEYIKYARPDDDTDSTPYYLRKKKVGEEDVVSMKPEEEEEEKKKIDTPKVYVEDCEYDILENIDEKTKLVVGKNGKEQLIILSGNDRYLMLSEIITKDLKSCNGKFKVDPENIPISDHCREINIIITFDKIGVPPLHLLVPVEYPKDICTIINPNFNERDRNVFLCRLISRVEQALPCLPIIRDIHNIVDTWINLATNA